MAKSNLSSNSRHKGHGKRGQAREERAKRKRERGEEEDSERVRGTAGFLTVACDQVALIVYD